MRKSEIETYGERSLHSLGWARRFLEEHDHVMSIQSSYMAAFYAAKAALGHLGIRSKYHTSVLGRLENLVREGLLPIGVDDTLQVLFSRRNDAAYRVARGQWTEDDSFEALALAEEFLGEMRIVIEGPRGPRHS